MTGPTPAENLQREIGRVLSKFFLEHGRYPSEPEIAAMRESLFGPSKRSTELRTPKPA